jgi:hypothetical protein
MKRAAPLLAALLALASVAGCEEEAAVVGSVELEVRSLPNRDPAFGAAIENAREELLSPTSIRRAVERASLHQTPPFGGSMERAVTDLRERASAERVGQSTRIELRVRAYADPRTARRACNLLLEGLRDRRFEGDIEEAQARAASGAEVDPGSVRASVRVVEACR